MSIALRLLASAASVLQLVIAFQVLRRRPLGPFRLVTGVLLILNGLGAFQLALAGGAPTAASRWFSLADGPTGALLVAAGILFLRFPRHDEWSWANRITVFAAASWAAAIIVPGLLPGGFDGFVAPHLEFLSTLPEFAGLGLNGLATALVLRRLGPSRASEPGFLGIAYVSALTANSLQYVSSYVTFDLPGVLTHGIDARFIGVGAAILLAAATLAVLLWPAAPNRTWRDLMLGAWVAGGLMALGIHPVAEFSSSEGGYALYLVTTSFIYILRPVCVGLVLARQDTVWALYDTAVAVTLLALSKLASLLLFGVPTDQIRTADLPTLALAALVLPAAWLLPRRYMRRPVPVPASLPTDLRLGQYLVQRFHDGGGSLYVNKPDIEAATGVGENNLAAAIRRLERRLAPDAPAGTVVAERIVGVRGRKQYMLTAEGVRRFEAMVLPRETGRGQSSIETLASP